MPVISEYGLCSANASPYVVISGNAKDRGSKAKSTSQSRYRLQGIPSMLLVSSICKLFAVCRELAHVGVFPFIYVIFDARTQLAIKMVTTFEQ